MTSSNVMGADNSWQTANRQELANGPLTGMSGYGQIALVKPRLKPVAERVIRTRIALDLSPTEFAALVGTDKGTYSKIESGERNFTLAMAIKLKKRKNIPLDWIFCGDAAQVPAATLAKIEKVRIAA